MVWKMDGCMVGWMQYLSISYYSTIAMPFLTRHFGNWQPKQRTGQGQEFLLA